MAFIMALTPFLLAANMQPNQSKQEERFAAPLSK
jgi:hypothetical protein